jgi:hypothetical protein
MNTRENAINEIVDFLKSDEKGLLITGTHQFEKHKLVMALLEKYYRNAKILFRINALDNIINDDFTPLKRKPKAGDFVRLENNYYCFDSSFNKGTWHNTIGDFDFALMYPIDALVDSNRVEPIAELTQFRNIPKVFYCTWTDRQSHDLSILTPYCSKHVIYDSEEEDPEYHKRVLANFYGTDY